MQLNLDTESLVGRQPDLKAPKFARTASGSGSIIAKAGMANSQSGAKSSMALKDRPSKRMLQNKREFKILFPATREYQSSTNSLSKDDSVETDCLEARFTPSSTHYASARNPDTSKFARANCDSRRDAKSPPQKYGSLKSGHHEFKKYRQNTKVKNV